MVRSTCNQTPHDNSLVKYRNYIIILQDVNEQTDRLLEEGKDWDSTPNYSSVTHLAKNRYPTASRTIEVKTSRLWTFSEPFSQNLCPKPLAICCRPWGISSSIKTPTNKPRNCAAVTVQVTPPGTFKRLSGDPSDIDVYNDNARHKRDRIMVKMPNTYGNHMARQQEWRRMPLDEILKGWWVIRKVNEDAGRR